MQLSAKLKPSGLVPQMRPLPDTSLEEFMRWYFEGGIKIAPPQDGILFQQRPGTQVTSVVLYREGPFQVELVTFAPGSDAPTHRHDHIESYEVAFSGAMELWVDGRQVSFIREPRENGQSRDLLKYVPIPSDAYHGGKASPMGGCFLSVQKWIGMTPSHVGLEWQDGGDRSFSGVDDDPTGA